MNLRPWISVAVFSLVTSLVGAVSIEDYGKLPDGRRVKRYVLKNAHGVRVLLLNYGATIAGVETPDKNGKFADITLGYDDPAGWLNNTSFFGVTVGRYANRIAGGKFSLDGQTYILDSHKNPGNKYPHIHGGKVGFDKKIWEAREISKPENDAVKFKYVSPGGEEGYPGTLTATVSYFLSDRDELTIQYKATTDKTTVVNLTNHAYWNLTGDAQQTVLKHVLEIPAKEMLPVDTNMIPTGAHLAVTGTPFDFTKPAEIGSRINDDDDQIKRGHGYDHCWVLPHGKGPVLAARVHDPFSGRILELFSDQPGIQLYTANFMDGSFKGKGGISYKPRVAFCLEPEKFPDSPNHPDFPSSTLKPGEVYEHTMILRFSTR